MKNEIIKLAFLRNHLLAGIFTSEDKDLMKQIRQNISESNSIFKEIAVEAIANCESDIEKEDFVSAANEINLIHNFHFFNPDDWNSDYFYNVELLTYLEKNKNPERTKKLIILLARLEDLKK